MSSQPNSREHDALQDLHRLELGLVRPVVQGHQALGDLRRLCPRDLSPQQLRAARTSKETLMPRELEQRRGETYEQWWKRVNDRVNY